MLNLVVNQLVISIRMKKFCAPSTTKPLPILFKNYFQKESFLNKWKMPTSYLLIKNDQKLIKIYRPVG